MTLPDPFVFTKKTVFMQRLSDLVRGGASHYIHGQIDPAKLPRLAGKFSARYPMPAGKVALLRAKRAGGGAARLLSWLDDSSGVIQWVLFYWPGDVPCTAEKWLDPTRHRITLTHYELVRVTKSGAKKPVWTWRYERNQYHAMRDEIIDVIRLRQDARLDQIIHSLHRSPGFSGAREQVKKLWQLVRTEWKRTRSKSEPCPTIPARIGYVRRLPDTGMLWSELVKSKPKKGADDGHTLETPRRKASEDFLLLPSADGGQAEKS